MNPLTQTHNQRKMNERELELGVSGTKNSWHMEYRDSAWIFLGGLPYEMTEGDVICMFSQYGEVVHINLIRDHGTGKSKGFGFLCYMDQRSTILAVDNLNGIKVLSRMIRVDHVHQYKLPKDLEKLDQDKRKLFEEGCAPKEIDADVVSDSSEEEIEVKPKKDKSKKKKKKRRHHSTSSETDSSDSDEDRRKEDERGGRVADDGRKGARADENGREKENENGWTRRKGAGRESDKSKGAKQEKSLEERLRDMANYVKDGESHVGDKRMSAREMFEKESKPARVESRPTAVERPARGEDRARERRSRSADRNERDIPRERKPRSRSRDNKERSRSRPRKDRSGSRKKYRRSVSAEKEKTRKTRRSSSRDDRRTGRSRSRDRRRTRRSESSSSS